VREKKEKERDALQNLSLHFPEKSGRKEREFKRQNAGNEGASGIHRGILITFFFRSAEKGKVRSVDQPPIDPPLFDGKKKKEKKRGETMLARKPIGVGGGGVLGGGGRTQERGFPKIFEGKRG